MRRLISTVFFCLLLAGCKRGPDRPRAQATDEGPPPLATVVHVADPQTSAQLLSGFYGVEQNSWRWTQRKFSVNLRPPADSARVGAMLVLKFTIPDPVIDKLKNVTLSASVGGVALQSDNYSRTGEQVYSQEVPAKVLAGGVVVVDFALDKALPPGPSDHRELGVVVTSIGLEPK